jgi:hypothetical protein
LTFPSAQLRGKARLIGLWAIDQLVFEEGFDAIQTMLPIDMKVMIVLLFGNTVIGNLECG